MTLIVVRQQVNVKLRMEVIDRGAYDCLVPPVAIFDLAHIVRCDGVTGWCDEPHSAVAGAANILSK